MLAGHVGVGLALKGAEPRANAGALVAAALGLDLVFGVLLLAGVERAVAPPDFAARRYFEFELPYSHALVAALGWSALAALVAAAFAPGGGAARLPWVVAAVVALHWPCDWLVHTRPLSLGFGIDAPLGPALWQNLPLALAVEGAFVVAGAWIYLRAARETSRARRIAVVSLALLLAAGTLAGQWSSTTPPPASAVAWSSIVTTLGLASLLGALDRPARAGSAR